MLTSLLLALIAAPNAHAAVDCQSLLNHYFQLESGVSNYAKAPTPLAGDAFDYDLSCHGFPAYATRDGSEEAQLEALIRQLVHPLLQSFADLDAAADDFNKQCPDFRPQGGGEVIHADPKSVEDDASRAYLQQLSSWAQGVHQNATMGREYVAAQVQYRIYETLLNNGYLSAPIGGENPYLQSAWIDYSDIEKQMIQKVENHDLRYTPEVFHWLWDEAKSIGASGVDGGATPENPDGVLAKLFSFMISGSDHLDVQAPRGQGSEDVNYSTHFFMYSSKAGSYGTQYDSSSGLDIAYVQGHLTAGGHSMVFQSPMTTSAKLRFDLKPCDASPIVDLVIERFGAASETWSFGMGPPVVMKDGWMSTGTGLSLIKAGVANYSGLDGATAVEVKLPLKNGSAAIVDDTRSGTASNGQGSFTSTLKLQVHQGG